ncbi:hypothetical protein HYS48_01085 [Candidatus Woesearchaeota archaeon]|nr:hypothetical protein [Candidatus Woesearchaeota archaeon]
MKQIFMVLALLLILPGVWAVHNAYTQTLYDKDFFVDPSRGQAQRILDIRSLALDQSDVTTPSFIKAQRILEPKYRVKYGYSLQTGLPEIASPYDDSILYVLREERLGIAGPRVRYPENVVLRREARNEMMGNYRGRLKQKMMETRLKWYAMKTQRPPWMRKGVRQMSYGSEDTIDPRIRGKMLFTNPY